MSDNVIVVDADIREMNVFELVTWQQRAVLREDASSLTFDPHADPIMPETTGVTYQDFIYRMMYTDREE